MLYNLTLAPDYFQVIIFGSFLNQTVTNISFINNCTSLLQSNSSYSNYPISALEIYNSSIPTEPLKLVIYS
jgi:hypothetical protein